MSPHASRIDRGRAVPASWRLPHDDVVPLLQKPDEVFSHQLCQVITVANPAAAIALKSNRDR
jgi:hypothetical protein